MWKPKSGRRLPQLVIPSRDSETASHSKTEELHSFGPEASGRWTWRRTTERKSAQPCFEKLMARPGQGVQVVEPETFQPHDIKSLTIGGS